MDSNKTETTQISTPIGTKFYKRHSLKISSMRPVKSLRKTTIIPKTPIQNIVVKQLFEKTIKDRT